MCVCKICLRVYTTLSFIYFFLSFFLSFNFATSIYKCTSSFHLFTCNNPHKVNIYMHLQVQKYIYRSHTYIHVYKHRDKYCCRRRRRHWDKVVTRPLYFSLCAVHRVLSHQYLDVGDRLMVVAYCHLHITKSVGI